MPQTQAVHLKVSCSNIWTYKRVCKFCYWLELHLIGTPPDCEHISVATLPVVMISNSFLTMELEYWILLLTWSTKHQPGHVDICSRNKIHTLFNVQMFEHETTFKWTAWKQTQMFAALVHCDSKGFPNKNITTWLKWPQVHGYCSFRVHWTGG